MKTFILILFTSFLGLAAPTMTEVLIEELQALLTEELQASDAEMESFDCGSYYDGILCSAEIKIFDTVSNGATQGGGLEVCQETYIFRGGDSYQMICSSCEYSRSFDYFDVNCGK